jgi:hypothetical protein
MIHERDVWQAAKMLIDQHGDGATVQAAKRIDEMCDVGDLDGQAVWAAIMKAVIALMHTEPDGAVH